MGKPGGWVKKEVDGVTTLVPRRCERRGEDPLETFIEKQTRLGGAMETTDRSDVIAIVRPVHTMTAEVKIPQQAAPKICTCQWMFADAGSGLYGIRGYAYLNPLRWSKEISIESAIADLERALKQRDRPMLMKSQLDTTKGG